MTDNNNALVMTWFQQQQTPAGWFDLLLIMVDGMVNNAGELESQPFLRQMGEALADEHPLPASETLGELEANMNAQLSRFQWGVVSVEVSDDGLRLRHQALPMSRDEARRVRWCNAFCAILEGFIPAGYRDRAARRTWCYSASGCFRSLTFSFFTSIPEG